jgi:hypothetical protein
MVLGDPATGLAPAFSSADDQDPLAADSEDSVTGDEPAPGRHARRNGECSLEHQQRGEVPGRVEEGPVDQEGDHSQEDRDLGDQDEFTAEVRFVAEPSAPGRIQAAREQDGARGDVDRESRVGERGQERLRERRQGVENPEDQPSFEGELREEARVADSERTHLARPLSRHRGPRPPGTAPGFSRARPPSIQKTRIEQRSDTPMREVRPEKYPEAESLSTTALRRTEDCNYCCP